MAIKKIKRSKKFSAPAVIGTKAEASGAMRVGKDQIKDANDFAQSAGCGRPYGADGKPVLDRAQKRRLMQEINRRRVDAGESRYVNLDGGYGDET